MEVPGVLGSFPSRLRTIGVAKALLQRGCLLMQVRGAAVGGKLTRLRSPSAFPCSSQPVRFVHHCPYRFQRGFPVCGSHPNLATTGLAAA
jgi:hypothetical protein